MSQPNTSNTSNSPAESPKAVPEGAAVNARGWTEMSVKTRWKPFPDPAADEPVRIALSAEASAAMSAHAKESLDKEVCGVLVGERCEDDHGTWVFVKAPLRGTASRQGGSHVTYTQETWEKIYEVKDRDYPKLDIVGWYHTHPGFGVEFSDMDKFIQQNFFAGAMQFALVLDPLGGDEAICVNTPEGITYVAHYWLDGRRRTCRVPRTVLPEPESAHAVSTGVESRLKGVEERLQQLLVASEEDRVAHHRFLLTVGMFVAMAAILWISFNIYTGLAYIPEPPKINNWIPVPMKVGDDVVMVGLAVAQWKVPPELNAVYVELEKQRREAEAEKQKQEDEKRKAKPQASGAKPASDQGQSGPPAAPAKKAAERGGK